MYVVVIARMLFVAAADSNLVARWDFFLDCAVA